MQTIFIILTILFILPILVGWFLKRTITVIESRLYKQQPAQLFSVVQDLASWNNWSAWSVHNDSSIEILFGEKHKGPGASFEWKGKKMGKGKMEIIQASTGKKLTIESGFNARKFKVQHQVVFNTNDTGCQVVWTAEVKTKYSSIARILGRLFMRSLRRDISIGLQLLEQVVQ